MLIPTIKGMIMALRALNLHALRISFRRDQLVNEREPVVFLFLIQVTTALGKARKTAHHFEVGATNVDLVANDRECVDAMRSAVLGQDGINSPSMLFDILAAQA